MLGSLREIDSRALGPQGSTRTNGNGQHIAQGEAILQTFGIFCLGSGLTVGERIMSNTCCRSCSVCLHQNEGLVWVAERF